MLYCFDLDGTLVRSFMREGGGGAAQEYDLVEVLPGRRAKILQLVMMPGSRFALVTNQAGVAFGFQSMGQVYRKVGLILAEFCHFHGRPVSVHACFTHPNARVEEFRADDERRKPGGGMLLEAIAAHRMDAATTLFVGDMEVDKAAAIAAGVRYYDAKEFFDERDG